MGVARNAISPELVLVDPELRRAARLLSNEEPAAAPALAPAFEPEPSPLAAAARFGFDRLAPAVFVVSLLLNFVFAGTLLAEGSQAPSLAPPARAHRGPLQTTPAPRRVRASAPHCAANSIASVASRACASAKASPAANASPQP